MKSSIERLLRDISQSNTIQQELVRLGWEASELEAILPASPKSNSAGDSAPDEAQPSVVLYTDGACRGNPGPSSAGWVIEDPHGRVISQAGVFLGTGTNNEAEYSAAILGLEAAFQRGAKELVLRADSELMIKQLKGIYRVKNERLKPLFKKLQSIIAKFQSVELEHVKRHLNQAADRQANLALDERR